MEVLELLFGFAVLVLLVLFGCFGSGRFNHWRGPVEGSPDAAQREHLRQFHSPPTRKDEDDE